MTVVGHVLLPWIYLPVGNRQINVDIYSTFLDLFSSCPGHGIYIIPVIPLQECTTPHDGRVVLEILRFLRTGVSRFHIEVYSVTYRLRTFVTVYGTYVNRICYQSD